MEKLNKIRFKEMLHAWSMAVVLSQKNQPYKSKFVMVSLGSLLTPAGEKVTLDDGKTYSQLTVKTNGGGIVVRNEAKKSGKDIKTRHQTKAGAGQFLFSKIDARNGAFGIVPKELDGAVVTAEFPLFTINTEKVVPEFLLLVMTSEEMTGYIKSMAQGSTNRKRLDVATFLKIQVPLPAMEEQKRMMADYAEMQKKMEAVQRDEAVTKNLTELNEKLDKENRELSEQLGGKQDEVAKGLQTISKLRDEVEKQAKEIDRLKSHIKKLEDEKMAMEKAAGEMNAGQAERPDSTDKNESGNGQEKALSAAQTVQHDTPPDGQGEKKGASHEEHMEIPIGYTMTLKKDGKVVVQSEVEPVIRRKPSAWQTIMGRFAFPKKSQQNFVQMIIKKELSPEQVNEIKQGLAKGLNEEQMDLIINKDLTPERIRSIVEFAVLQNSLNAERGCVA